MPATSGSLKKPKSGEPGLAIEPHVMYPLPEFMRRTGWGRHAVRAAKAKGLTVRYAANRGYVHGKDFIDYLLEDAAHEESAGQVREERSAG